MGTCYWTGVFPLRWELDGLNWVVVLRITWSASLSVDWAVIAGEGSRAISCGVVF